MRMRPLPMILILLVTSGFCLPAYAEKAWYPVNVDVWEPPFNQQQQRVQKSYMPLDKSSQRWKICVSIPHLKDAYWLAVNYGLVDEARRLGVDLAIYEAGGYGRPDVQRKQIQECVADKPDGLIISAISGDGLSDLVEKYKNEELPVLDLINGMSENNITARVSPNNWDMAKQVGQYLIKLNPASKGDIHVAWFPGPDGAAWVAAGDDGFKASLKGSNIKIINTFYGDTGKAAQAKLVKAMLDGLGDNPAGKLDYIVGTSVTAEAAVDILRRRKLQNHIKVFAYYYGPGVHRGIKRGSIIAAPTDSPVNQARLAVDTMVRILEGQPYDKHFGSQTIVVDRVKLREWDSSTSLAPKGFRPIFSVDN